MFPRHARLVLSRLGCNGHSLLFSSYLCRIGRIENPSCSPCRHSSHDIFYLIWRGPAADSLHRSLFGDSLSFTISGPDRGELPGFWGCMVFRHVPIPRKGSGNNNSYHKPLNMKTNNLAKIFNSMKISNKKQREIIKFQVKFFLKSQRF